jgi:hypothetical protein
LAAAKNEALKEHMQHLGCTVHPIEVWTSKGQPEVVLHKSMQYNTLQYKSGVSGAVFSSFSPWTPEVCLVGQCDVQEMHLCLLTLASACRSNMSSVHKGNPSTSCKIFPKLFYLFTAPLATFFMEAQSLIYYLSSCFPQNFRMQQS